MLFERFLFAFAVCGSALAQNLTISVAHTATTGCAFMTAEATAVASSSSSNVKGKVFDRILFVYLETTDFAEATADPNCAALAKQGLLLTNLYGVGAPSQPAYMAAGSGDTFGLNSDSFILVNENISTIVDLLEDKGVSWSNYNQGAPYAGFEGFEYDDGLYMRKHALLPRFDSIRLNPDRISRVKNDTSFYDDLHNETFPQWSFFTPNLWNDGHNSNQKISCGWVRGFVETLLQNSYFNDNALIYVTWQANGVNGSAPNHVAGIITGSALPNDLVGKTDDAYYNHYSELATVEANWGLHHLGRWDVGANVWDFVGQSTGDPIREWNQTIAGRPFDSYTWNQSYGGVFSNANDTTHTYVKPNGWLTRNGRTILPAIWNLWKDSSLPSYYKDDIELPDAFHPPQGFQVPIPDQAPMPITYPILTYPYSDPPSTQAMTTCPTATSTASREL